MVAHTRSVAPVIEASNALATLLVTTKRTIDTGERFFFDCFESDLQRIVFALQEQFSPSFLDVFVYQEGSPLPWSPTLSQALSDLAIAGWIGRPDLQAPQLLQLKPAAEKGFDAMIAPFLAERATALREIADAFLHNIRVVVG